MKSYIFRVVIEPDKFEDGRDAWHGFCPALKGCHTWGHTYEEALATSAKPLTCTFRTSSNLASKFPSIRARSNCQSPPLLSTYDAHAARHLSSAVRPGLGSRWVRPSAHPRKSSNLPAHDARRVVVVYHALSDTFPVGTLRGMIADAGWRDEDLQRLGLLE
jgi:hypothetical protein